MSVCLSFNSSDLLHTKRVCCCGPKEVQCQGRALDIYGISWIIISGYKTPKYKSITTFRRRNWLYLPTAMRVSFSHKISSAVFVSARNFLTSCVSSLSHAAMFELNFCQTPCFYFCPAAHAVKMDKHRKIASTYPSFLKHRVLYFLINWLDFLPFLCLTSCMTLSALCSLLGLPSR